MTSDGRAPVHGRSEWAPWRSRRRRWWWLGAGAITVVTLAAGVLLLGPSPPRRIVLAGGQPGGAYASFAREYRDRLRRVGLDVVVAESNGSVDNVRLLLRGVVDVAFVQAGTAGLVPGATDKLRGLAALYFEPLWVFHRDADVTSTADLRGKRVSIGPTGSGTEEVARALLREYGISEETTVVNASNSDAARRLLGGELDAAMFVSSYRDATTLDLLGRPGVHLLAFRREVAHARKLPPLQPLKIPEGVIDLRRNIPARDTPLLAVAALLVSRADLHPRVAEQLLKVAQAVHQPGSLIDPPMRFPSLDGLDLAPHDAAQVYLTEGESFLSRTLPYGVLRWVLVLRVLILPLIVWIPLLRLLPAVSDWRAERQLAQLYGVLRKAERAAEAATTPDELREHITALDRLAVATEPLHRKVPAARQRDVYNWRVHIALVRGDASARLQRMEETPARSSSYAGAG